MMPTNLKRNPVSSRFLSQLVQGRLLGEEVELDYVADIREAGAFDLAPVLHLKDRRYLRSTQAGALLINEDLAANHAHELSCTLIVVESVGAAFLMLANFWKSTFSFPSPFIAPDAQVHPTAVIHRGVVIGAGCFVGPYAVIGGPGFVYTSGENNNLLIPTLYGVHLADNVSIGAHTCVDAGILRPTRIGAQCKIDNLVQIGHDVQIGRQTLVVAQSGIGGHSTLGERCLIAGQVGIADHVTIGNDVTILAKSAVMNSVKSGQTMLGAPAVERKVFWKKYKKNAR